MGQRKKTQDKIFKPNDNIVKTHTEICEMELVQCIERNL